MIEVTIHIEADRLASAIEILAAAILGTPASKAEGTQFQLRPVRGHEGADPAPVAALLAEKLQDAKTEPVQTEIPAPLPTPVTLVQVRAACSAKSQAGKKDAVTELIKSFGASALSAVDPAKYPELLAKAEAL